jgi:hypothetical protein
MIITNQPKRADDALRMVVLSHLGQAQALAALIAQMGDAVATCPSRTELGAILEDIGNAYLDLSEDVLASRAPARTCPTQ